MFPLQDANQLTGVLAPVQQPSSLQLLCAYVQLAIAGPSGERHRRVASALQPYLELPDLLDEVACPASADRYARHLLHAAADFTILALVWRPGQMSAIHHHRSWCAFGTHSGCMTECLFVPGHDSPTAASVRLHTVGNIGHSNAGPHTIHRLANLGSETAITIHAYGVRYDDLGEKLNHVWAG